MVSVDIKSRILEQVAGLFESKGIQNSGIEAILTETGVAKATLYRHFPSKDALVIAFLQSKAEALYAYLDQHVASTATPRQQLVQVCELLERWIDNSQHHVLPFHIASVEFPDASHPVNQFSAQLARQLQDYLSQLASAAGARDALSLAVQLTMLYEGASLVERLSPGGNAPQKAREAAMLILDASIPA